MRGSLGDIDPLKKVPCKRARSRVKKGRASIKGGSLILPRSRDLGSQEIHFSVA